MPYSTISITNNKIDLDAVVDLEESTSNSISLHSNNNNTSTGNKKAFENSLIFNSEKNQNNDTSSLS